MRIDARDRAAGRGARLTRRQRRRRVLSELLAIHEASSLARSAGLTLLAIAAGVVLSGCASVQPDGPGDCVGPPDFCVPFFGS
ncbi:hypothetical protein DM992_20810 [Burkholderia sp. JP2-270]|nr:hypothetical protein DM992_20810 [Burkholderia sp. JP2-270]